MSIRLRTLIPRRASNISRAPPVLLQLSGASTKVPLQHTLAARSFSPAYSLPRRTFHVKTTLQKENDSLPHSAGAGSNGLSTGSTPSANTHLTNCPGCGAFAQMVEPEEAGFYSPQRRAVRQFLEQHRSLNPGSAEKTKEDALFEHALAEADADLRQSLLNSKIGGQDLAAQSPTPVDTPLCDRCHVLLHHHTGTSIHHPSAESLADTISESPYKYNHIYHVLDAADFPMSLIPRIHDLLELSPLRGRNRRAKHATFRKGRKAELSFVITRSDLLAPKKEQVDHLMPYLTEVLRDALGRVGRGVRLGNVHCVSAKRGWWTKQVKANIWDRGGAGWMVGKVNVGKSNLFQTVFPKGRADEINFDHVRAKAKQKIGLIEDEDHGLLDDDKDFDGHNAVDEESLLPPLREETPYPVMPTVSALPGTTASPIRIPFGNGKGELIDLPGLKRTDLELIVRPDHREHLVMKSRISPEQLTIKPGQSLLVGGMLRITPKQDNLVILAYPFVPLKSHVTSTEKALSTELGGEARPIPSILIEEATSPLQSAGVFALNTDVTKARAGPLTQKSGVALKPDRLAFKVLATDILIESVGWIELVVQVRKRDFPDDARSAEGQSDALFGSTGPEGVFPEVEIFTPGGKFIASRRSMGAWLLGGQNTEKASKTKARPRRSVSALKRRSSAGGPKGAWSKN